jgi:glycosyltransferase involved in cell wall biosynthesis
MLFPKDGEISSMKLTVVMPAYNEGACIENVARTWLSFLDEWKSKSVSHTHGVLLVVNDGSKDRTGEILARLAKEDPRLCLVNQKNSGHGAAVLRGYNEALAMGSDYVFQTDSDDQFSPADFWSLWEARDSSPFVTGYRQARSDATHRLVIAKIVLILNFLLFGAWLKDANIPYRLIQADFLRSLLEMFPDSVFAPNIFLSVLAKKAGCDLQEIPIKHVERTTGTVSIVRWRLIKSCFRCLKELLTFRFSLLLQREQIEALRTDNA